MVFSILSQYAPNAVALQRCGKSIATVQVVAREWMVKIMDVAIRILAMIGMFIFGYMLGKESKGKSGKENDI